MATIRLDDSDTKILFDLIAYIRNQVSQLPQEDYVVNAIREGLTVKTDMLSKVLNGGIKE